jgi:uncharacterized protein (DUF952 family)/protein associated with RNAse G/E
VTTETIYHITERESWDAALAAGEYVAPSLETQGFIHASTREQVVGTANLIYAGRDGLVLLCIDPSRLEAPLRWEPPDDGPREDGTQFPHVYGALNLDAVVDMVDFPRGGDGRFQLPPALRDGAGVREILVRATNYDGSFHWGHAAWLVSEADGLVMTRTEAGLRVERESGGEYVSPYNTRAHYWTDRWFNVIRLETPGKGLYGYYCNVATPLQFDGATVGYVDLQLDVRVLADEQGALTHWLADEDEFEEARLRYGYDDDFVARCYGAVEELARMVEAREFPFDS